jgi:hypothetical protein
MDNLTPRSFTVALFLAQATGARYLAAALENRAEQMGDPTGLLRCMADAHLDAARRLENDVERVTGDTA